MSFLYNAVLLIGPTGSGKTPLGNLMERTGFKGQRAVHFDFGEHLRSSVTQSVDYPLLTDADIFILKRKLRDNALLEDHEFHLAEKLVLSFVKDKMLSENDMLVLNGLPRHAGQAQSISRILFVGEVIYLHCSAEVVHYRIATDSGGDRLHRTDDSLQEVERKLNVFRERTFPLIEYYRMQNVPIHTVEVGRETDLGAMMGAITRSVTGY